MIKIVVLLVGFLIAAVVVVAVVNLLRGCFHVVPTGHIGLVTKKPAKWIKMGSAPEPYEVRLHGGAGPQVDVLSANSPEFLPPWRYSVEHHPLTTVPPGTIGVVFAHFGRPVPVERQLARHVECDNFTDARSFLLRGGEMGRQARVLASGHYPINPLVFEVLTTERLGGDVRYDLTAEDLKEVSITNGHVGVVTVHEGRTREADQLVGGRIEGHASFQYPDRFLDEGGTIGTQEEVLSSGGVYRINPWFAQISLMPTRELILQWQRNDTKSPDNYDAELESISISVDGVGFRFNVSQTMRITERTAPILVARLGDDSDDIYGYSAKTKPAPIKRFVNGVLSHIVEGNILAIAQEYTAISFIVSHSAVQAQLETQVRHALAEWGIEAGQTTLSKFEVDDPRLTERLRDAADAEQVGKVLKIQEGTVLTEAKIAKIRQQIKRGELALNSAELEDQVRLLGEDRVAMDRFLGQLAKMQVPEWVGGGASEILNSLPLPVAKEMINNSLGTRRRDGFPVVQKEPLDRLAAEEADDPR